MVDMLGTTAETVLRLPGRKGVQYTWIGYQSGQKSSLSPLFVVKFHVCAWWWYRYVHLYIVPMQVRDGIRALGAEITGGCVLTGRSAGN